MNAKHNPKWTKGHNPRPETLKMLEKKKGERIAEYRYTFRKGVP